MRHFLALMLLIGLGGGVAVEAPEAHATFPGRNGVLSVSYVFGCVGQIATLGPDGHPLRMLTPSGCLPYLQTGDLGKASWSPDGRQLIFAHQVLHADDPTQPSTSETRFAIMNADGSALHDVPLVPAVEPFAGDPTFSTDGERILYTRSREIWSARLDGSDDRRLIADALGAQMSPDGRRIAVVRPLNSNLTVCAISIMNARTGKPIRRLWRGSFPRSIDWSPDSKRLLFTDAPSIRSDSTDVYVVRADGKRLRRLTATAKAFEIDAVWSPNGRRVAFVREVRRDNGDGFYREQAIWTIRSNGTAERRIRAPWIGNDEDGKGQVRISWQALRHR